MKGGYVKMFRRGRGEMDQATELVGTALIILVGAYALYKVAVILFGS